MAFDRWRHRLRWDGTEGTPRSANAASSFHLGWQVPAGEWVAAEATLEVVVPPVVDALCFWALQVSFVDRGRDGGGAHLGLQWYPPASGVDGGQLGRLPTRGWRARRFGLEPAQRHGQREHPRSGLAPRRPYRLRVAPGDHPAPAGATAWRGEVTDTVTGVAVVVRDLFAAGDRLASPMVWSELFTRCDDPGVEVRWSALRLWSATGEVHDVQQVRVNYQALGDGGCSTTDVQVDADGVVQRSGTRRRTPTGAVLAVPRGAGDAVP